MYLDEDTEQARAAIAAQSAKDKADEAAALKRRNQEQAARNEQAKNG